MQQTPAADRAGLAARTLDALSDAQLSALAAQPRGLETLRALRDAAADAPAGTPSADARVARADGALRQADAARLAKEKQELLLDLGQIAVDIVGIFEPTPFADLTNAGISIWRGNWLDAGLSALGVIPYLGDAAKLGKLGKFGKLIERAVELAKLDPGFADQLRPVLRKIKDAIDAAPIDSLPGPARDAVRSMKGTLDEFFAGPGRFPAFVDGARHVDPVTGRTVIDAAPGSAGRWNGTLNRTLEPNVIYRTDTGHLYHTDSAGRVTRVEGELQPGQGARNGYQQRVSGRNDRLPTDQGGHLIATIFRGPGEAVNLVPMDSNLNLSAWKQMENRWAEALTEGRSVEVRISPVYQGDSLRPSRFDVTYRIEGEAPVTRSFRNRPGG